MFLRSSEIHERAALVYKCGHPITYHLFGLWHQLAHNRTDSLKLSPELGVDALEIFINARRCAVHDSQARVLTIDRIAARRLTDDFVGLTGFEPATPTPPV